MIGKALKGLVKLVIGKSAAKSGLDPGKSKTLIDLAGDIIDKDDDIQKFIFLFEGQYSDLKTKAEGIVRTMQRPFLTIFFSVNLVIMIYLKIEFPQIMAWATITLIGSLAGTKGIRDWNQFRKKEKKHE